MSRFAAHYLATALLCASLWMPLARAGDASLQQLHQVRSLAFTVCANVLVQFNDYEQKPDPRRADNYHADLAALRQIAERYLSPTDVAVIIAMQRQVAELDALPGTGPNRYGHGLEALLQLQVQLDQALAERYAQQARYASATTRTLQALSLDTGRILLLYQIRTFVLLPKHTLDTSDDTNLETDARITQAFRQLDSTAPELSSRLAPIQRRYQFVRDKLINVQQNWAPSGVALYLERNSRDLDQLASD